MRLTTYKTAPEAIMITQTQTDYLPFSAVKAIQREEVMWLTKSENKRSLKKMFHTQVEDKAKSSVEDMHQLYSSSQHQLSGGTRHHNRHKSHRNDVQHHKPRPSNNKPHHTSRHQLFPNNNLAFDLYCEFTNYFWCLKMFLVQWLHAKEFEIVASWMFAFFAPKLCFCIFCAMKNDTKLGNVALDIIFKDPALLLMVWQRFSCHSVKIPLFWLTKCTRLRICIAIHGSRNLFN